jgi:cyclic pyranopterin phosphate synthase
MPADGISWMPHNDILSYEEIISILEVTSLLGIKKVRLTGGEPLVRKDVSKLVKKITAMQGIEEVSLTTNALLLEEQLDDLMAAGLHSVNISLDTINQQLFKEITRGGDVTKAIKAITYAKKFPQLSMKINCVPSLQEDQDIMDMVNFARKMDIPLRFIELMPIGFGKQYKGKSQQDILTLLQKTYGEVIEYQKALGNGPASYYIIVETGQIIGFISSISHKFCSQCNRIRLTANGYIKGCLQYQSGLHVKPLLEKGISVPELKQKIEKVIYHKPKAHHFLGKTTTNDEVHEMYKIGG